MAESRTVVVAVDGSKDSARAVEWAVPEARSRQLPLVLVHSVPRLLREEDRPPEGDEQERVDFVLRDARQRAAHSPAVEVTERRLEPAGLEIGPSIIDAVGADDLLVVGARGHGKVAGLVLGSVSQYAARHSPGTVVVVRESHDSTATRVVVGLDDSAASQRALDWALSRATVHGDEVVALRAWRGTALHGAANVLPLPVDAVWQQDQEHAQLEADLGPWREKHPGVRLVPETVPGHPGHLLAIASQHAGLVVVGAGGRGTVAATLLGSVTLSVLHHARCPVAVVR